MTQRPPRRDRDASSQHVSDHRHVRLQQVVTEELDALVRDELSDPVLGNARVRGVVLARDHKAARVHVMFTDLEHTLAARAAALERAASYLRRGLAEGLELKRIPELRFVVEIVLGEEPEA